MLLKVISGYAINSISNSNSSFPRTLREFLALVFPFNLNSFVIREKATRSPKTFTEEILQLTKIESKERMKMLSVFLVIHRGPIINIPNSSTNDTNGSVDT